MSITSVKRPIPRWITIEAQMIQELSPLTTPPKVPPKRPHSEPPSFFSIKSVEPRPPSPPISEKTEVSPPITPLSEWDDLSIEMGKFFESHDQICKDFEEIPKDSAIPDHYKYFMDIEILDFAVRLEHFKNSFKT